jgi:hypothetical protein
MLGPCSIYFSKLQKEQMNSVIFEVLENVIFKSQTFRHSVLTKFNSQQIHKRRPWPVFRIGYINVRFNTLCQGRIYTSLIIYNVFL